MKSVPTILDGAKVILYTPIDERHRATGNCKQIVAGVLAGPAAGLAICQYDGEDSFYLFGCDQEWNSVTDTCHQTVEDAKAEAEFEYEGVSATWSTTEA
jgi:hypothetical protein